MIFLSILYIHYFAVFLVSWSPKLDLKYNFVPTLFATEPKVHDLQDLKHSQRIPSSLMEWQIMRWKLENTFKCLTQTSWNVENLET
jgi:hypothetical protein